MRLINVRTGRLEEFFHDAPPYAILSHTWETDEDEILFRDVQERLLLKTGVGRAKFDGCCKQALADGLGYAWIDTCCIDKANSTELGEAINSMFAWYQKASICYAFLADVSSSDDVSNSRSEFHTSRWSERGWTLQELLAPNNLRFYSKDWSFLGTKFKLSAIVEKVTGIPRPFLLGTAELREASVAQRMSWAAKRVTKRREDVAYCLLGIFGVTIPMIYGEGDQAFGRLQEEIMRRNTDDSILAWNLGTANVEPHDPRAASRLSGGILAASPSDFANSGDIVCREQRGTSIDPLYVFGGQLRIHLRMYTTPTKETYGLLDCHPKDDKETVVGVPLRHATSDPFSDEYMRPEGCLGALFRGIETEASPRLVRIRKDRQSPTDPSTYRRYGFYVEESADETELETLEVEPQDRWEKHNATINTTVDFDRDVIQRTWIRFRHKREGCRDFVVMLELEVHQSRVQARSHVMTASRDTTLETISSRILDTNQHTFGKQCASNGISNLRVTLDEERVGAYPMFVVRLKSLITPPSVSVDVTMELAQLERQAYLRELLYEDRQIGPQRSELNQQIKEKAANAEATKQKLSVIQMQFDRLQLEKQTLKKSLSESNWDIEQLRTKDRELKHRRGTLSQAVTFTQDVLGRLNAESASQWHAALVDSLLKSLAPTNFTAPDSIPDASQRLLIRAVMQEHEATVQFLLDRGASVESKNSEGLRLLSLATVQGHEGLIQMLVDRGADVESVNKNGTTPLLSASLVGNQAVVGLLLDIGARIETKTRTGQTALGLEALKNHKDVARLLLDRGADVESKNADGWSPLHVAAAKGHKDLIFLLLSRGAELETRTRSGQTPLALAAMTGDERLVQHLLDKGAVVETRDANGWTPLFHAASRGHGNVMDLLLDRGADVNSKDAKGQVLVNMAIKKGQMSAAMLLIDRGATLETTDEKGRSSFNQAKKGNYDAIAQLLRRVGESNESLDSNKKAFWRRRS